MFKKKDGFTLVELLAIIVILGIIGTLGILLATGALSGSKKDVAAVQEKNVTSAAKAYFNEHLSEFSSKTTPENCGDEHTDEENVIKRTCIMNSDALVSEDYIDQPIDVKTRENITYDITITFDLEKIMVKNLKIEIKVSELPTDEGGNTIPIFTDTSGANKPVLADGMIPVVYDEENDVWLKASVRDGYYAYQDQIWANAVTVTSTNREEYMSADPGIEIPMEEINSMWVWIPRYSYNIPIQSGVEGTSISEINVQFETGTSTSEVTETTYRNDLYNNTNSNYYTHPAFRNVNNITYDSTTNSRGAWDEEITGFWVGKFVTGGTASEPIITSNPDEPYLVSQNVYNQFISSLKFAGGTMNTSTGVVTFSGSDTYGLTNEVDTHMMKSTERGAVIYLTQSEFGKIGNDNYIGTDKEVTEYNRETCTPESCVSASTTGTIYGVYMNTTTPLRFMGNYNNNIENSGFSVLPEAKYFDYYAFGRRLKTMAILGDSSLETEVWFGQYDLVNNIVDRILSDDEIWVHHDNSLIYYGSSGGAYPNLSFISVLIP